MLIVSENPEIEIDLIYQLLRIVIKLTIIEFQSRSCILHTDGVTGSNPVSPILMKSALVEGFAISKVCYDLWLILNKQSRNGYK